MPALSSAASALLEGCGTGSLTSPWRGRRVRRADGHRLRRRLRRGAPGPRRPRASVRARGALASPDAHFDALSLLVCTSSPTGGGKVEVEPAGDSAVTMPAGVLGHRSDAGAAAVDRAGCKGGRRAGLARALRPRDVDDGLAKRSHGASRLRRLLEAAPRWRRADRGAMSPGSARRSGRGSSSTCARRTWPVHPTGHAPSPPWRGPAAESCRGRDRTASSRSRAPGLSRPSLPRLPVR